jgi:hypothetical protein
MCEEVAFLLAAGGPDFEIGMGADFKRLMRLLLFGTFSDDCKNAGDRANFTEASDHMGWPLI